MAKFGPVSARLGQMRPKFKLVEFGQTLAEVGRHLVNILLENGQTWPELGEFGPLNNFWTT